MSVLDILFAAAGASPNIQYVGGYAAGYAGAATGQSVSLTSLTGGIASSPAADDLVIVYYGVSTTSTDISLGIDTAGYTEVAELFQTDIQAANLSVNYKFMGSTPDTTVTVSATTAGSRSVAIQVWRNVNKTTPLDVTSTTATGGNTILCNPPSITPSTAGSIIVAGGVGAAGTTNNIVFSSSDLSAFQSVTSAQSGNNATIGLGYKTWTSGAFDPAAFTINTGDNTNWSWAAVTMALRPA